MKINDRIKTRRKELNLTQSAVGSVVGVSRVSVAQWELGDTTPKGENLYNLATALKCSTEWLLFGKNTDEKTVGFDFSGLLVPLLCWSQIAGSQSNTNELKKKDTATLYPCIDKHSANTFCLKVESHSMHNTYVKGEIIFVDPDVTPISGDDVIVIQNNNEPTFKRLVVGDSKKYLQALNDDWPEKHTELSQDAILCGVVIGSYRTRK